MKAKLVLIGLILIATAGVAIAGNDILDSIDYDISVCNKAIDKIEAKNFVRKQMYVSLGTVRGTNDTIQIMSGDTVITIIALPEDRTTTVSDSLYKHISQDNWEVVRYKDDLRDLYIKRAAYK